MPATNAHAVATTATTKEVMIITDMSAAEYHHHPAIGSTIAKRALRSMRWARDAIDGIDSTESTSALQLGTLCHMQILEPDRFAAQVTDRGPINQKTGEPYGRQTKAWAEWEAEHPGVIVVPSWMHLMLERMPQEICELFSSESASEVSAIVDCVGWQAKCRPDLLSLHKLYDLKTIDDIDQIDRAINRYSYWFSAGWYRMVMSQALGCTMPWTWIFAEKRPPHRWRLVDMDETFCDFSDAKAAEVADAITTAFERDDWSDRQPVRKTVVLPEWMDQVSVDAEGSISL